MTINKKMKKEKSPIQRLQKQRPQQTPLKGFYILHYMTFSIQPKLSTN